LRARQIRSEGIPAYISSRILRRKARL
jgi:hypothetical protein